MKKLLTGLSLALAAQAAQANPQTVDIMVLYTKDALALPNGRDIDARIASYIEYANNAYAKSGANLRLRLVHKQLLDWATYYDVSSSNLSRFTNDAQVQRLREQYGADVVQLLNRTTNGQGYGVCGIAWLGTGAKNSDQFYSNAKDMAYGLTGVDCSLSTFAHEAGHNMGLRHSYEQDLQDGYYQNHSGTHEWSRGYGVQGQFSTIMAYPQVFGARRQSPLFSTPRLVDAECANQACGQHDHADAARALNSMAVQIANFRPTKVPNTGTPTNPQPELPWCSKPALKGLVGNGEFRTSEGWRALFGSAELALVNVATGCRDNALQFNTQGFDLLATPVSGLRSGVQYRLRAKAMLKAANSRENVRLAILNEDAEGRLSYSGEQSVSLSVTGNEFSRLEKSFTYKVGSSVPRNQYVAIWTDSGNGLLADEVELVEIAAKPPVVPPAPTQFGWNFENGIGGWSGFHGSARVSSFASGGRQALEAYNRQYEGSGASASLLGNVQAGQRYRFSADVTVGRSSSVSAVAYAYLYLEDSSGRGQYLSLGQKQTRGGTWSKLQQDIQLPAGTYRRIDLLMLGTQKGQSLFVDNVALNKL
ncbi:zinc-dependent metalloprotease family protein [Pseudomonas sp. CAU 1711]|uniref:zinc-dependent metalloprotease family protein n=1 Tax=Pseudomonas sp. CAU 1711 TaxID=3140356 RepID=UPI0032608150